MQTVWTGYDLNIYRTTPVAAFALSFSIRKELKKKKVSEIDSTLISLFHVQIQEPASSSTTTKAFVFLANFADIYHHKIFKTRNDDDLSIYID